MYSEGIAYAGLPNGQRRDGTLGQRRNEVRCSIEAWPPITAPRGVAGRNGAASQARGSIWKSCQQLEQGTLNSRRRVCSCARVPSVVGTVVPPILRKLFHGCKQQRVVFTGFKAARLRRDGSRELKAAVSWSNTLTMARAFPPNPCYRPGSRTPKRKDGGPAHTFRVLHSTSGGPSTVGPVSKERGPSRPLISWNPSTLHPLQRLNSLPSPTLLSSVVPTSILDSDLTSPHP